jgi:hypothetical protein
MQSEKIIESRTLICKICGAEVKVKKYGFKNAGKKKNNYSQPMDDSQYTCSKCRPKKEQK